MAATTPAAIGSAPAPPPQAQGAQIAQQIMERLTALENENRDLRAALTQQAQVQQAQAQ